MNLLINGQTHTLDVEPEMPLLWVLRDMLGLTGRRWTGAGARPRAGTTSAGFFSAASAGTSPRERISNSPSGSTGMINFDPQFGQRPFWPMCASVTSIEVEQMGQLISMGGLNLPVGRDAPQPMVSPCW